MVGDCPTRAIHGALSKLIEPSYCSSKRDIMVKLHPTYSGSYILISFNYIGMQRAETTHELLLVAFNKCAARLIPLIWVI